MQASAGVAYWDYVRLLLGRDRMSEQRTIDPVNRALCKHWAIRCCLDSLRRAFDMDPGITVDWNERQGVTVSVQRNALRLSNHYDRHIWKCYREQGGGQLETPRRMTESQAVAWLQKTAHVEVTYIERNHPGAYFIFYKPRA